MAINIINNVPDLTDISQLTSHGGKKGHKSTMMKRLQDMAELAQGTVYVRKKPKEVKNKIIVSESEESQIAQNDKKIEKSQESAENNSEDDPNFVNTYA